jgi:hypothetical protein|tara:strand:- start:93 stop:704 length:612 start_codon:yes stop_codon:yes gene_type:complete
MTLQSSGAISLNDIHVEAGGTSGTTCTINDSDIRDLIDKNSGATMSFDEWYGASADWSVTLVSGTQSYRGVQQSTAPTTGWTSQSYNFSGSITDDTFDPIASQGIASTSTVSTPGIIRDLFTNNASTQTFFRIWAVTEPSDSGWSTITCQGTGSDTTNNVLNRTQGNAFYNTSQKYRQYRWGVASSPQILIPSFSTTYTITVV